MEFANRLSQIEGVEINVCVIENHYFGGDIHIAGLITATDIIAQLKEFSECHSVVYVPRIAVRDDSVFLDDYSLEEVRQETGKDIRIVGHNPRALVEALGLVRSSSRDHTALPSWIMEENLVS